MSLTGSEDEAVAPATANDDPPKLVAGRWTRQRGRHCDLWLCAVALAVGVSLVATVAVCMLGVFYRGALALVLAAGAVAVLLLPGRWIARRIEALLDSRRPVYFGELLDGLWLPRPARLTCWLVAVAGSVAIYSYSLFWAPQSPWDAKADELRKLAVAKDNEFKRLPPTEASAEERGRIAWAAEAARQGADFVQGGTEPKIRLVSTGPRPTVERGKPWTDPMVNWGEQATPEYLPDPKVPTKSSRLNEYQTVQEAQEQNGIQLNIFTLPLAPVFALIGWGASTKYTNRVVKAVHTVFEGQVLSADDLYALLDEVPRHGLVNWQDRFAKVVNEAKAQGKLTDAQATQFLSNLNQAVTRAMQEKQKQDSELVKQVANLIKREVGKSRTPEQVVNSVRGVLTGESGGRFPSTQFEQELKAAVVPQLVGKMKYWDKLCADLKPTD